ncbi:MAG: type I 3-dehydroquinate dehydratase [bacterium]|nr:type I 3-dehydroquinate dehydratase [bacterium]
MKQTVTVRNVVIGAGIPKVCVSIIGKTKEEILSEARAINISKADVAEWRVDWFEQVFEIEKVKETARELREVLSEMPILFTFRTLKEGGEKEISDVYYTILNKEIAATGSVDLIDVEAFTGDQIVEEIIEVAHQNQVFVVASNHDFYKTPDKEEIINRLRKMQDLGADISKIAVMPQTTQDVLTLLQATDEMRTKYATGPIITMSMGAKGVISRVAGEFFGSALTFGARKKASAPGQMGLEELDSVLHALHNSCRED